MPQIDHILIALILCLMLKNVFIVNIICNETSVILLWGKTEHIRLLEIYGSKEALKN